MNSFESLWEELSGTEDLPSYRRVNVSHPLDLYVGVELGGERSFLLVSDLPSSEPRNYSSIDISLRRRQDGKWALLIKLLKIELSRVFDSLCQDLAESSRYLDAGTNAGTFFLHRIERWQNLIKRGHPGILDEAHLMGLMGELLFLREVAIPLYGKLKAVESWIGPMQAPQDFDFERRLVEVKSIHTSGKNIRIASVEQLDVSGIPLSLVIVVLDKVTEGDSECVTPCGLVTELLMILDNDPEAKALFENRISLTGFNESPECHERGFSFRRIRHFIIDSDFPRLTRQGLPAGIGDVVYEIMVSSITPYECMFPQEG